MSAWLFEALEDKPFVVHRTAVIGDPPEHREWLADQSLPTYTPIIEPGVRINSYVTVDSGWKHPTRIGARSFLMTKSHVGHDAIIGKDCELGPGTMIGGHVTVGDGVKFGLAASVKPYVSIGSGARIGMGAVVTKNVPAGEVWVGNPAHPLPLKGADQGQCASCGEEDSVEWYLDLSRPHNQGIRQLHGRLALCEACYRRMMTHLEETPEKAPLGGYT